MTREDYEIHKKDYKDRNVSQGAFVLIQDVYISILEAQLKKREDEIERLKVELKRDLSEPLNKLTINQMGG